MDLASFVILEAQNNSTNTFDCFQQIYIESPATSWLSPTLNLFRSTSDIEGCIMKKLGVKFN